jgi:L-phenylalanine/L-methionine N-acetyltransferase
MKPTIIIRRVAVEDAADIAEFMSDEAVFGGLLQMPYPGVDERTKRIADTPADALSLVAELRDENKGQGEGGGRGKVVASAGLFPANPGVVRRRHVMTLGIGVAASEQRQGIGRSLMQAMLDWADNWGQVLRIELTVYADNAAAIALYQQFGFVHEGTHHAHALRAGEYVTTLSFARLHPKPPVLRAG